MPCLSKHHGPATGCHQDGCDHFPIHPRDGDALELNSLRQARIPGELKREPLFWFILNKTDLDPLPQIYMFGPPNFKQFSVLNPHPHISFPRHTSLILAGRDSAHSIPAGQCL